MTFKKVKQMNKQAKSRNHSINTEKKLLVARGEGVEEWAKWMKGRGRYRLPVRDLSFSVTANTFYINFFSHLN